MTEYKSGAIYNIRRCSDTSRKGVQLHIDSIFIFLASSAGGQKPVNGKNINLGDFIERKALERGSSPELGEKVGALKNRIGELITGVE